MSNKTLFNTSEKSNFILNMTEEKYSAIASKVLCLTCILGALFAIPYEASKTVGVSIISGGLAVCGVICMIMALIAVLKKFITKRMLIPIGAFGAMLVFGLISTINSFNFNIAFYGADGRGEGFLALIFYFCIFITAVTVKGKKKFTMLSDALIVTCLVNSLWALLQLFIDKFHNIYRAVPLTTLETDENGVTGPSKDFIHAVCGLSYSPIFLAFLLSMGLCAAFIGTALNENKNRRIFYGVSAAVMSFVMVFTYSLVGWVGFAAAVIFALITVFVKKAPKIRLVSVAGAAAATVLSLVIIMTGSLGIYSKYSLHDGPIMWNDSWFRLDSSGNYNTPDVREDITVLDDTAYTYNYLNKHTFNIIKRYPLLGTGPENLVFAMVYEDIYSSDGELKITGDNSVLNEGTFDKCYNEYLYIAATRGLPSLLAFLVLLVSVIAGSLKKIRAGKLSGMQIIPVSVVLISSLLFIVGTSSIAFAPVFWVFAGLCAGSED